MKTMLKFLVVLGIAALVPSFPVRAEVNERHREITIWVPAPVGTHIGGGYGSSFLTDIRSKSLANEEPRLRNAIDSLDALGMRSVRGLGLVPAAVSWQTEVPIHTLVEQQAQIDLSYGELLMVNFLATKSGQTFNQIISSRVKTRTWSDLAQQIGVDLDQVVRRANRAAQRIRYVELHYWHRPSPDAGTSYTSTNPHLVFTAHRY
jgi:hypothetical protein